MVRIFLIFSVDLIILTKTDLCLTINVLRRFILRLNNTLLELMKLNLIFFRRLFLFTGMLVLVTNLSATDVPKTLGNGLDKLVESRAILKKAQATHAQV